MTAAPARGIGRQKDIPAAASRTPLSSPDDSATSSNPTPTSTHTTASHTPLTPQRGRLTARYPDSLGRVPLHRRGTSKTYECLEDLLREAGYKETRVFTPETDRNARSAAGKQDGGAGNSMRGSVGAVVDFITGFVSRASSLSREAAPLEDSSEPSALHAWSPPPSPLAGTIHVEDNRTNRVSSKSSLSRHGSSEGMRLPVCADLSTDASQHTHAYQVVQLHQSSQALPHHHSYLRAHNHHHINRHRHRHQLNNYSSKSSSTKPNPPNARAYLRHMVSAPNIQPLAKRPPEASLGSRALGRERRNGTRRTFILNDEDSIVESDYEPPSHVTIDDHEHQVHPPLPRNWIESVAKALLSGVGGPAAVTSDAVSTRTAKTASLSDKSNRQGRGRAPTRGTKPPLLCAQVQDVKGRTSEGQVACTRVTCRSTPTSRASSRARSGTRDNHAKTRNDGKTRVGDRPRNHRKGKDRDADVVPSLARTKVENDDWMAPRQRYSRGWGMEDGAQVHPGGIWSDDSDDPDDDDDEDEDEEGELGLDRLLVPARRQHSIQSLRKHLRRPPSQAFSGHGAPRARSPRNGRTAPFGGAPSGHPDWGNVSSSRNPGHEWLTSQGEEGEDGYGYVFFGSEVGADRSNTKWRRGLPGLAQWTVSS